jgi:energy-coupling factor transporter ATP-binding protein EcfA2
VNCFGSKKLHNNSMQRVPFIVKELSVRKMPGFPRGMEPFTGLSPDINLIAGPNASGKSSTARLIQGLIWKGGAGDVQAESSVMTGNTRWEIKLDQGRRMIQREGIDDEFTGIPSPESSGRYMLALHDLISANESDLARYIMKESVGGYDIDEAQAKLGYSNLIKNKGSREYADFKDTEDKYRIAKNKQEELKKKEEKLRELYLDKVRAEKAAGLCSFYNTVKDYLLAKQKCERISSLLGQLPEGMERFVGDEYENLLALDMEIEEARKEIDNAGIIAGRNRERLSALKLPAGGVDQVVIEELDLRVRELERLEREAAETDKKISGLKVAEAKALKSIGENLETSGWEGLKLEDVSGLDRFIHKYHFLRSESQFYRARLAGLEKVAGTNGPVPVEKFKEGIKLLSCWLQEERSITGIRRVWVPVLAAAGIAASLSVLLAGGWGMLAVLAIVAAGILALNEKPARENNMRRSDYEKTGLKQPGQWETGQVADLLEMLASDLALAEKAEENRRETAICREQLAGLEEKLATLRQEAGNLLERLKAIPGLPGEEPESYDGLYWFLVNVTRWQECHAERMSCTAARDEMEIQYKNTLAKFNEPGLKYNSATAGDAAGARSILQELIRDSSTWKDCTDDIARLNDRVLDKRNQIERALKKQEEIYGKLAIDNGLKLLVQERVSFLEDYKNIRQQQIESEAVCSEKNRMMAGHSLYLTEKEKALSLAPDEVDARISALDEEARMHNELQKTITEIETEVKNVKQGHGLEDALREKEKAGEELMALFERNLSSLTGQLLVDHLKKETREQNRPRVFKRANELFNRITRGRYELLLGESDDVAFRAYDTVLKLGQDLRELSTGTRIQLVMAVRLAFIETQESAVRLPILADELLANCDDIRAGAIIEALVEISREGRQVFYFTAQGDEVARWKSYLDGRSDVSSKIIELSGRESRSSDKTPNVPLFGTFDLTRNITRPDGASRGEYRELLAVPRFNILEDAASRLHLWYLVEDNQLLYDCLKNGISHWGQLESFLSAGRIEGFDEALKGKLEKKIRLLSRFCELYSMGRSRPVSREVIRQSGAVSGNHIENVALKLTELGNDPEKLIRALRNGEIPRFLRSKIDELEQFFISGGYIDQQQPLSEEEILLKLNAYLSTLDLDLDEAQNFLHEIAG